MAAISKNDSITIYETMKTIRAFEEQVFQLTTKRLVQGSVHFYIGQEAVATGICHCLEKEDYIMSNHRCHGHLIAKGGDLNKMMAELMGRKEGYCSGKGGTMHLVDPSIGMMGANGIVGGGNPIALGLGYACKNFEKEKIVVSFFGDGAINTGAFHESLNLASLWGLPILFVCENNQYAISTSVSRSASIEELSQRAIAYGIPGKTIDGNDIGQVIDQAGKFIGDIRKDLGPALLVCDTYRQMGHSIHDPRTYRTKEEEEGWKDKDPIIRYENTLIKDNRLDKKKITAIQKRIDKKIKEAVDFALGSPVPESQELYRDVYAR